MNDLLFSKRLSLPWSSSFFWNKWFERSPYSIFYLLNYSQRNAKVSKRHSRLLESPNILINFIFDAPATFFLYRRNAFKKFKPLWKHAFSNTIFLVLERVYVNHRTFGTYVNNNQKIITQLLYKRVIRITLNSKQNRQEIRNTERRKTSFFKRIDRKCRITKICIEENNELTRIMHKIQF